MDKEQVNTNMEQLTLAPISKVSGVVNVPGSKSLSNRALLLAALCEGDTELTNLLDSGAAIKSAVRN